MEFDSNGNAITAPIAPIFNTKEHEQKFDAENPEIEIPDPVIFDIDTDWVLSNEEEELLLQVYFANKIKQQATEQVNEPITAAPILSKGKWDRINKYKNDILFELAFTYGLEFLNKLLVYRQFFSSIKT